MVTTTAFMPPPCGKQREIKTKTLREYRKSSASISASQTFNSKFAVVLRRQHQTAPWLIKQEQVFKCGMRGQRALHGMLLAAGRRDRLLAMCGVLRWPLASAGGRSDVSGVAVSGGLRLAIGLRRRSCRLGCAASVSSTLVQHSCEVPQGWPARKASAHG